MSSIIKVDTIQLADGTAGTIENLGLATGALSHRNLIINGDMRIAQRNTQVTSVTSGAYRTCDRWYIAPYNLGTWTIDQSTDAPDGYKYSLKLTCTTADSSPAAGDYLFIRQKIERQNVEHLKWGTSDALALKLSFWVKSNQTGTFGIETQANSSSSVETTADVTINSADTWEYKTVTIPANTSYALEDSDNGHGISIWFWLNAGTTYSGTPHSNWADQAAAGRAGTVTAGIGETVNDYFAVTAIQLEVGSVATPFEHRGYDEELRRCQRYYQKPWNDDYYISHASRAGTGWIFFPVPTPVTMRTEPSITHSAGTVTLGTGSGSSDSWTPGSSDITNWGFNQGSLTLLGKNTPVSISLGYTGYIYTSTSSTLEFDAEL